MLYDGLPSSMSDSPSSLPSSPPEGSVDSALLRVLMETLPDRIYFKDLQSRFVWVNHAYATWHGFESPAQVIGKTDFDLFTPAHAAAAYEGEQQIIRTGEPMVSKVENIMRRDGSEAWGSTTKMAWRDADGRIIGTFGLTRDVTAAKEAENKLIEERNLLRTIIDHLPSRIFVKDTQSRYLLNNRAHLAMLGVKRQEEATGRTTLDFFPNERGRQALADDRKLVSGGPPLINQEKCDFAPEGSSRWVLTTKVPLHDLQGSIAGLVGISHDITQRKQMELELQRRTAEMEADVRMARQIQEAFFPRVYPVFPRGVPAKASALRFAHRYVPAASLGGDFFDILQLSDTQCGVLICDVMGHGVRAGLLTALICGVVGEIGSRADDPAHVLAEINRSFQPVFEQTGQPVFATAFYGIIDTAAQTITYSNAGHPPPFLLQGKSRTISRLILSKPEPFAGLVEGFTYSCGQSAFCPGDMLLGCTDGVLEAADREGQLFGETRLAGFLSECVGIGCTALRDRLMQEIESFTGRREFDDDLCVVAIEAAVGASKLPTGRYEI